MIINLPRLTISPQLAKNNIILPLFPFHAKEQSFLHLFWNCQKEKTLWNQILNFCN
jgi:hypothetical protein